MGEFLLGAVISRSLLLQEGGIWCGLRRLFSAPFPVNFHPFLPLPSMQHRARDKQQSEVIIPSATPRDASRIKEKSDNPHYLTETCC